MRTEAACCPKCTFQRPRRRAHSTLCVPLHGPHEKHTPMQIITAKQTGQQSLDSPTPRREKPALARRREAAAVQTCTVRLPFERAPCDTCAFLGVHSQTWGADNPTHSGRNATQCIYRAPTNLAITSSHLAARPGQGEGPRRSSTESYRV